MFDRAGSERESQMRRLSYQELWEREDAPEGSSWGLFGDNGTIARIGRENVKAGKECIRTGEALNLDYPLNAFQPPFLPARSGLRHEFFSKHIDARDDIVNGFNTQSSSQIDGLRHRRDHDHGFYNGTLDSEVTERGGRLGIGNWAKNGIVSRGVLIDIARARAESGSPIDHYHGEHLGKDDIQDALARQMQEISRGDIVLLHTGWANWYLNEIGDTDRKQIRSSATFSGLDQSHEVTAWLWDSGAALIASDTYAVEALPASKTSPFQSVTDGGMMHQYLLARLGLPLGELWKLDELSARCAEDGNYDFLLTISPLYLAQAVASPANALAIR